MYTKTVTYMSNLMHRFREEEDGLALTEYVILLGLLVGVVIAAVITFGGGLGNAWQGWANWIETGAINNAPGATAANPVPE